MTNEFDEFRKNASELQDKVKNYQNMFRILNNLFPEDLKSGSVSGKITLSKNHPEVGHLEITVMISRLSPESDLKMDLGIEIGQKNIGELEKIDLPHPNNVQVTYIEEAVNNDLLEEIVDKIDMHGDGFAPVN
jgi:hypothetical protein